MFDAVLIFEYTVEVPKTRVAFYAEDDGSAPALEWISEQSSKVQEKLFYMVARLEAEGYALRRPEADLLRDKIYELRVKVNRVNYRLLYFFFGHNFAVVAHGCTKEGRVEISDIDRAVRRRDKFLSNPKGHTYAEGE